MIALDVVEDIISSGRTKVTHLTAPVSFYEDSLFNQNGLKLLEIIQRDLGGVSHWGWRWRGARFVWWQFVVLAERRHPVAVFV